MLLSEYSLGSGKNQNTLDFNIGSNYCYQLATNHCNLQYPHFEVSEEGIFLNFKQITSEQRN